jgi:hypothetical protein
MTTVTATTRPACVCLAARDGRLWRTSAWARAVGAFVFRSCCVVGGCWGTGRFARSLVLVAFASAAVTGRVGAGGLVGGQVARQCVVDILLMLLWWQMCAAVRRQGWACTFACMFVRTLLAASDVWGRVIVRKDCDGGRGGACLFVCVFLFVAIDLFIAALAACLCGWLIRSPRHCTADNDDGHGDDATRLRVFGGACSAALADVRLDARSACVRVQILPLGWRVFGCLTFGPEPRVVGVGVGVGGVRVVAGRVGRTLLAASYVWRRVVVH